MHAPLPPVPTPPQEPTLRRLLRDLRQVRPAPPQRWAFALRASLAMGTPILAGYWLGNLPWVKQNLSFVIVGIVLISLLPAFAGWLRHRKG